LRYVLSVKFAGTNPVFYGPFESEQQAKDWQEGAEKAWAGATFIVLPLESPW
jgi:hypothetical protein